MIRRCAVAITTVSFVALGLPAAVTPAQANSCPPSSVGGRTVARIKVGSLVVPVKSVTYRSGGVLNPPATNQAAGLSSVNMPLDSSEGTAVLTWHVRYGPGCYGTLNRLMTMPIGSTFQVGATGKHLRTYKITQRVTVPKGQYRWQWFRADGPYRIALFTCSGFRNGVFHNTVAIFASPVTPAR